MNRKSTEREARRPRFWLRRGVVVVAVLALVLVAVVLAYRIQPALRAQQIGTGKSLPSIDADLFYFDAESITARGPSRVIALRFNSPVELVPFHLDNSDVKEAAPIEAWGEVIDFPVLVNAGQFDEKGVHLGWLKSGGQWLSRQYREQWKGLLVSGPSDGPSYTGIIDLELSSESVGNGYRHLVQSMMLLDEEKRVRVRESARTACRTVVAQDAQGRTVVVVTEGATTLVDLAKWLPSTSLELRRAMNLDGGFESQLLIHTDELSLAHHGQYGTGSDLLDAGAGPIRTPLPAVLAIRPVRKDDRP